MASSSVWQNLVCLTAIEWILLLVPESFSPAAILDLGTADALFAYTKLMTHDFETSEKMATPNVKKKKETKKRKKKDEEVKMWVEEAFFSDKKKSL